MHWDLHSPEIRREQRGRVSVVTAPVGSVVGLSDLKLHLRIDHSSEDVLIAGLERAAVNEIDAPRGWLGRSLIERTLRLAFDETPSRVVHLPGPPVTEIESVEYRDRDTGEMETVDAESYRADLEDNGRKALLYADDRWPSAKRGPDAFRVTYRAGYKNGQSVPDVIRQYLMIRVADLYRDREGSVVGTILAQHPHIDNMLEAWRVR